MHHAREVSPAAITHRANTKHVSARCSRSSPPMTCHQMDRHYRQHGNITTKLNRGAIAYLRQDLLHYPATPFRHPQLQGDVREQDERRAVVPISPLELSLPNRRQQWLYPGMSLVRFLCKAKAQSPPLYPDVRRPQPTFICMYSYIGSRIIDPSVIGTLLQYSRPR